MITISSAKLMVSGFLASAAGWLADTNYLSAAGVLCSLAGGLWSLVSYAQDWKYKRAERKESHAEHVRKMKVMQAELDRIKNG